MATNVAQLLETLDSVMVKIAAAASLPGVNMIPYAGAVSSVISAVHMAYTAGKDITPYITAIQGTFSGAGAPSQADIDALNTKIAALEAQVQAPLPPKEEGEPD